MELGVRKEGFRISNSKGLIRFHVGASKQASKNIKFGPHILDPQHHSVVVIKENKNPNVDYGDSSSKTNGLDFKNLVPPNSLHDALKETMASNYLEFRSRQGSSYHDKDRMVPLQ